MYYRHRNERAWKKYCIFDLGQDRNYEVKYYTQTRYNEYILLQYAFYEGNQWGLTNKSRVTSLGNKWWDGRTGILDHITARHNLPVLCQKQRFSLFCGWNKCHCKASYLTKIRLKTNEVLSKIPGRTRLLEKILIGGEICTLRCHLEKKLIKTTARTKHKVLKFGKLTTGHSLIWSKYLVGQLDFSAGKSELPNSKFIKLFSRK